MQHTYRMALLKALLQARLITATEYAKLTS